MNTHAHTHTHHMKGLGFRIQAGLRKELVIGSEKLAGALPPSRIELDLSLRGLSLRLRRGFLSREFTKTRGPLIESPKE